MADLRIREVDNETGKEGGASLPQATVKLSVDMAVCRLVSSPSSSVEDSGRAAKKARNGVLCVD
jgi:hypothetical protein